MKRRTTLALVSAVVLVVAACGSDEKRSGRSPESSPSRAEVERFAHVSLPRSARDLRTYTEQGLDKKVEASFSLDRGDLDEFTEGSGFSEPLRRCPPEPACVLPFLNGETQLQFPVDNLRRPPVLKDRRGGVVREVIVDVDRPGRPIVYVLAFTT